MNAPIPDPVPTSAEAFRTIRQRLGLSQRQAAKQLHVSRRQVQRWENHVTPVPRWPAQLLWAKEHMVIPADYWCQCHPGP